MHNKRTTCLPLFQNTIIVLVSITFAIFISEVLLRFTPYKRMLIGGEDSRYYYKNDDIAGYDISENFPRNRYSFVDADPYVWSNELGCFDNPYKGEKNYILLTGDSWLWGFAPFESKAGTIIENCLDKRVLKCAVTGYGTKQELLKIKGIIQKTKNTPQLIIVGYCLGNDFLDDWLFPQQYTVIDGYFLKKMRITDYSTWQRKIIPNAELKEEIQNTVKQMQDYKAIQASGTGAKRMLGLLKYWLRTRSVIYNILRKQTVIKRIAHKFGFFIPSGESLTEAFQLNTFPRFEEEWKKHLENISGIRDFAQAQNSNLLFIIIPSFDQVYDAFKKPSDNYEQTINSLLQDYLRKQKIDYLDLTSLLREYVRQKPRRHLDSDKDLYWRFDGHWNIRGNQLVGLLISKYLLEHNLITVAERGNKLQIIYQQLFIFSQDKN